jgi:magnesium transporter
LIRYFCIEKEKLVPTSNINLENITWCDAVRPTDDELMEIAQKFNIDIGDLEDIFDETERPRFNFDLILKNNIMLLQVPISEELDVKQEQPTYPLGLFLTVDKKIITIQPKASSGFEKLIELLNKHKILDYFFLTVEILHGLVNEMDKIVKKFILNIQEIQKRVLSSQKGSDIQKPFQFNSYLIFYSTAMVGNLSAIRSFYSKNKSLIDANIALSDKFEDMVKDMEQVYSLTSIYRSVLSNSLDAFSSVINNNMTMIMKVVASISLILMIPTLVASIFGMNVYFPGISPNDANLTPLLLIVILTTLGTIFTWVYFRRVKWL